jgi:ribose transport system permease protein
MTELASEPAAEVTGVTPAVEVVSPPATPVRRGRALGMLTRYALLALLIVSVVVYSTWPSTAGTFATPSAFRILVSSQAVGAVLTLGLLIPLVAGQIDLSIGNITGLAAIATASAYADHHAPVWAGILVGTLSGLLLGAFNGLVITVLRVESFIATIGTTSIMMALVQWYTGGLSIIQGIPASVPAFAAGTWLGIPRMFYVMLVVALIVYYLLEHTPYGRKLHAIGANRAAARLIGIRVTASIFGAFALAGTFAGVAGVMLVSDSGAGNPQVGNGFTLTAVAAVLLGAAAFQVGRVNVLGTLVAIYFIAVNISGLTLAGVHDWVQPLFSGVSLVLAIALVAVLGRRRARAAGIQVGPGAPGL